MSTAKRITARTDRGWPGRRASLAVFVLASALAAQSLAGASARRTLTS